MSGTVVFEDAKLQAVELIAETVTLNNFSVSTATTFQQTTNASNVTTNTLRFTNPATAFVTTGNVGVGTVSPNEKLHVNGNIRIGGATGVDDNNDYSIKSTGQLFIRANDADLDDSYVCGEMSAGVSNVSSIVLCGANTSTNYQMVYFKTRNTERMRIDKDGNVGIGTTSPIGKLDVWDGASNGTNIQQNAFFYLRNPANAATNYGAAIVFENTNGASGGRHSLGRISALRENNAANYSSYLQFSPTVNGTEFEAMRLTSSGNVGIGTTNPNTQLDCYVGTTAYGGIQVRSQSSGFAKLIANAGQGGHNSIVNAGDLGIVFSTDSDHTSDEANKGFYIAPWDSSSGASGIRINENGNVGIGTAYPATSFHVYRNTDHDHLLTIEGKTTSGDDDISGGISFKHTSGHATGYRGITWYNTNNNNFLMGGVTMAVGGAYNNCRIAFHAARNKASGDTVRAYIDSYGTGGDLNFTGQHRCFIKEIPFTQIENVEGLIVSADNNKYIKMSDGIEAGSNAITTNESLPVVSLSNVATDKKCFGVISASEDPESRQDRYGNIVSVFEKEKGDTRVYINSVGEGAVWITNINGNLESGDYITTSNVTGYGMKQDSEFLANYTVAKITMDCDFEPVTQPVQQIVKELSNVNYWVETTYTDVELEEYSNLTEENRRTVTDNEIVTYQKIERTESTTEREGWALDVRQELVNVLDEHGQLQWEDHPTDTEKAYKIRYLTSDGQITDESNAVHIAAFVGCTYHCG